MDTKKTVLIVDGDEILRDGMRSILEGQGYVVDETKNGSLAKDQLLKASFDLIISDFQDGIQLLTYVKENTKSRFLLLSELSEVFQAKQAYQLGADEFLKKPFNKSELLRAVESSLLEKIASSTDDCDEGYVQVPLSEFVTGTTLQVDLFLRLNTHKYVKVGNKGEKIPQERIDGYVTKGLRWLYMRKHDFGFYVGFNITLAQAAHSETTIEGSRKIRLTKHVAENIIAQLHADGLGRDQLEDASNVVMNTVEMMTGNRETIKLLENLEISGSLPAHSIAVSIWACLIAKKMGWTGQSTFFKVALCGLFHDIGQKEIPEHLTLKKRFELTSQEVKILESHTVRGREILRSVHDMPEDVALVAAQHHELWHGGGFPMGLRLEQIHPMARLVALADQFCEMLRYSSGGEKRLCMVYELMSRNRRDFDPTFLKKLGELVGEATEVAA